MYKKILVPTDASEFSVRAFKTAVELAKLFQSEIVLIHVTYTPQTLWGNTVPYGYVFSQEDVAKNGQLALDATMAEGSAEGVKTRTVLEIGHPVIKIIDQIKKDDIDLVVIGSHGYGPITGSVLGSVSQRVLQKSPVPVLLVK
ncbi:MULTISPECIES: universal stress protein [Desulfitobacterium]|uniref:Universal stress protein n=1 Tax=Desulfitobacterium dehalogenans (strain ATCC 51507 / DSM 9161 / JW/IU-DC1) TaxID=756499 RepID=I4A4H1_DESDJ|nr:MULTISPECIES: universal stress protein [Desulfitobacterium]AFL98855.1 universal stress protein UspA-like protein [Desulfitobacterium dehalogenans ATCC 51507]